MQIEHRDEVLLMRMEAGKANAMSPAYLAGLEELWGQVEGSGARAVVLTGYDRFFCAGLDLVELADLDRDAMRDFMRRFHQTMAAVFDCPLPVVAAVNGHAIAGGCVLAMQADWRVMVAGSFRIGLNETQLGVGLPVAVIESLRARVPPASWNTVALEGRLLEPEEALTHGLVDEVAAGERVLDRALERARELARVPARAFAHVKRSLRRPYREAMDAALGDDEDAWLDTWFSEESRALVAAAVEAMRSRPR